MDRFEQDGWDVVIDWEGEVIALSNIPACTAVMEPPFPEPQRAVFPFSVFEAFAGKRITRHLLVEKAMDLNPLSPIAPEPLDGGIQSCDCICHLPIGPGRAAAQAKGALMDCVHCRLLA